MKKLSLILALMLVLSCFAFAACSDDADTSSTASTSSETSKDTSKTESKTESNDSSDEASNDSSDAVSDESSAPAVDPVGTNVAAGKSYTTSKLYAQNTTNWEYDESFPPAYPDTDNKELTDGILPEDTDYNNAAWAGLHDLTPDAKEVGYSWITIDLEAATKINYIKLFAGSANTGKDQGVGIGTITEVTFYGSNDGTTFELIGTATSTDGELYSVSEAAVDAEVQYVQVRMVRGGWTFVTEVEIYAA